MGEKITAIYENGVFRPLSPVRLQEHQTVDLEFSPSESTDEAAQIIRSLIQAGILTPPPGVSDVGPVSEAEIRRIADVLGDVPGKPLSELVIEERGER